MNSYFSLDEEIESVIREQQFDPVEDGNFLIDELLFQADHNWNPDNWGIENLFEDVLLPEVDPLVLMLPPPPPPPPSSPEETEEQELIYLEHEIPVGLEVEIQADNDLHCYEDMPSSPELET